MRKRAGISDLFYELGMIIYLLPLWGVMLLIDAGLKASKKLFSMTGWRGAIDTYKTLHICGEKLSRHIRRMIPD